MKSQGMYISLLNQMCLDIYVDSNGIPYILKWCIHDILPPF